MVTKAQMVIKTFSEAQAVDLALMKVSNNTHRINEVLGDLNIKVFSVIEDSEIMNKYNLEIHITKQDGDLTSCDKAYIYRILGLTEQGGD